MKVIEIQMIPILRHINWANSNGEARRMLESGGIRIDNEPQISDTFYFAGSEFILSFGRRKYARIILPIMRQWYDEHAEDYW